MCPFHKGIDSPVRVAVATGIDTGAGLQRNESSAKKLSKYDTPRATTAQGPLTPGFPLPLDYLGGVWVRTRRPGRERRFNDKTESSVRGPGQILKRPRAKRLILSKMKVRFVSFFSRENIAYTCRRLWWGLTGRQHVSLFVSICRKT